MILPTDNLRERREAMGLNALEFADAARCPVEVLVRLEMGEQLPREQYRPGLAEAYGLSVEDFLRLALDIAERRV